MSRTDGNRWKQLILTTSFHSSFSGEGESVVAGGVGNCSAGKTLCVQDVRVALALVS